MILKAATVLGWIFFALDAAFLVALFVIRDAGNDAAGRGVGRGWALVLLPVLLAAGALLLWGTRSGSRFGVIVATFLVGIPFMMMANGRIRTMRENANDATMKAEHGRFASSALRDVVRLIDAGDTTALRALLAQYNAADTKLDYHERDAAGSTLLGFAVTRASDYSATPDKLESLKILLQSGVPYAPDATESGGDWTRDLVMSGGDQFNKVIEVGLDAGANPNAQAKYDKYPMLLTYEVKVDKAKMLVRHGADVHALTDVGYTALMNAIRLKMFPEALYYLEQGVDPDHVAPDGATARTLLAKAEADAKNYHQPMDAGYDEFVSALNAAKLRK